MTRKDAHEYLKNIKVYVENIDKCRRIQQKLFECGYDWQDSESIYVDCAFIFTDANNTLFKSGNIEYFEHLKYKQVTADEILNIVIDDEDDDDSDNGFYIGQPVIYNGARHVISEIMYTSDGNHPVFQLDFKDWVLEKGLLTVDYSGEDERKFKHYDRVIVRSNSSCIRKPRLFAYVNRNGDYECTSGKCYTQCRPYKGNEHLVGTTND